MNKGIWINNNPSKDGETTSIRAIIGDKPNMGSWKAGNQNDIARYMQLYIQGGNKYYGYL